MKLFSVVFPIVMILDFAMPFLVALPYQGYSHRMMAMSVLGCANSPLAWVYNLWTILSGAVFIWAGHVLFVHYASTPVLRVVLFALFVLYGIGCEIMSGLFLVNETKDVVTATSQIHGVGSVIGFIALLFAPLVMGIIQYKTGDVLCGIASIASFFLAFTAFTLFVLADKPQFEGTMIGREGLWQRISLAWMYLPIFIQCLRQQ